MKYFTNNEMKEIAVKFMKERVLYYKWNIMLSLHEKFNSKSKKPYEPFEKCLSDWLLAREDFMKAINHR